MQGDMRHGFYFQRSLIIFGLRREKKWKITDN